MKNSLYIKIYNYYLSQILSNNIKVGDRLPSIREACLFHNVSKTTIESAYLNLAADGYVIGKSRSGYYVIANCIKEVNTISPPNNKLHRLSSSSLDDKSFDFKLWKRYVKSALRQENRLISYGMPMGELELRMSIADYLKRLRHMRVNYEQIVVGAGTQDSIALICLLFEKIGIEKRLNFLNKDFKQANLIFDSYGYEKGNNIAYVTASKMDELGAYLSYNERLSLLRNKSFSYIIEDDYDNEFCYDKKIIPTLKSLDEDDRVIYMGSFSRLLLPGIRISYLVLNNELLNAYNDIKTFYNQKASLTEQIALCQFIRDGHIYLHHKRIKRFYLQKQEDIYRKCLEHFKKNDVYKENNFLLLIRFKNKLGDDDLKQEISSKGVGVKLININNERYFILNSTSIEMDSLDNCLSILSDYNEYYI